MPYTGIGKPLPVSEAGPGGADMPTQMCVALSDDLSLFIGTVKLFSNHYTRASECIHTGEREIVVYWYSFSNPCTMCMHYGFSLVGNNLNNTRNTP